VAAALHAGSVRRSFLKGMAVQCHVRPVLPGVESAQSPPDQDAQAMVDQAEAPLAASASELGNKDVVAASDATSSAPHSVPDSVVDVASK